MRRWTRAAWSSATRSRSRSTSRPYSTPTCSGSPGRLAERSRSERSRRPRVGVVIDPATQAALWTLAALLIAAGLAGLVLPAIPGIPLIFVGLVLLAWAENFAYVGWGTLTFLGALAVLSYGVDLLAVTYGAKRFGA